MAAKKKPKKNAPSPLIASNKRARHDFFIEETYEAGLELMGWEVKSLRGGRGHVADAYVQVKDGEAWLFGATITPLLSASTHVVAEPMRPRRLLLHRQEIDRLIGAVDRKGYTLVPLNLHWHRGRVKLDIGLGKGKKLHDKRADTKDRDWQRQKERILKKGAG
ncbi:MAG: SsrA-binding protein SmpB [Pseudomonadota bacterium]